MSRRRKRPEPLAAAVGRAVEAAEAAMAAARVDVPATKAEALERGLPRYFTGKACPRGHVAERRTDNGRCVQCVRETASAWQAANPERHNANSRAHKRRVRAAGKGGNNA